MTSRHCPDCYAPVAVAPQAREGRCHACRPISKRQHSVPRPNPHNDFVQLMTRHNRERNYSQ